MEIINIEAKTFEAMLNKFESFADRMEHLCRLHGNRDMSEWLDNQDVCPVMFGRFYFVDIYFVTAVFFAYKWI